ncbi:hypothetical protein [Castellaniella sp.]|uniref:hypothetical protein n=1 Tax=Castellaniella sp. TaxID=1955812 RepID=UPI002AFE3315|nr:hypothetical protein [Castellaniella sp.]
MKQDISVVGSPIDPYTESSDWMLMIAFPKSPSKGFPLALSIAQQASEFRIVDSAGILMHVAHFAPNERDAKLAIELFSQTGGWKGVVAYSKGRPIKERWAFISMLECYLESCECTDPDAHCCVVIDDPSFEPVKSFSMTISVGPSTTKPVEVDRYLFPCSRLWPSMRFQPDHPSSLQDQIQAAGVKNGCYACPRFDAARFEKISTATYQIDV